MPRALLTFTMLAVCVVLPASASAKEPRSALVERESQLTHAVPNHRADERRMSRLRQGPHCAPRVRGA
jgi:hypothetical protein